MKKLLAAVLFASLTMAFTQCSDKGGDDPAPPDPCSETKLAVTTTPEINSTTQPQISSELVLSVNITAGFPAAGATINVVARNEATNTQVFEANPSNVTGGVNNITITNLPAGATTLVQVTVTSKNCLTNKWTGNFRYVRK